ncbi:MAG: hypothetical protein EOO15_00730 [Chitinophagaceae bacterium]|nr:MAG: hypothetical protein EOO15_00730 [Chitinophagaceae bacterium]
MAQVTPQLQLKALEILHSSVSVPQEPDVNIGNFHFNINLDTKADAQNKLLVLIVQVEIKNEDQKHLLGSLVLSNIFEIANFEQVITVEYGGNFNVPQHLTESLANQAIATARGVLFASFKGTFLHNAVLPLIDMKPQS